MRYRWAAAKVTRRVSEAGIEEGLNFRARGKVNWFVGSSVRRIGWSVYRQMQKGSLNRGSPLVFADLLTNRPTTDYRKPITAQISSAFASRSCPSGVGLSGGI